MRTHLLSLALALLPATTIAQELAGVVFWDRNANGRRDDGELGLGRIPVSNQETVVLTDNDGNFTLPRGRGHGIVFVSVPDGYRAVGSFWKTEAEATQFAITPIPRPPGPRPVPGQPVVHPSFTFIHASDTHISEPTAPRMRRLRAMVDSLRPAFVLITGDLVRDALRVGEPEATTYYELFSRERNQFQTPVFTVPGNHEIFGIERARSGVDPAHPLFGKTMYRRFLGPDYYSFTYNGVHFVGLNTADVHGQAYYGNVDSLQLAWIERDLARFPPNTPVVTFNHIPFYSTGEQIDGYMEGGLAPSVIDVNGTRRFRHVVGNAPAALRVLSTRRHVLALGGHVHIGERIDFDRSGQRTRFENAPAIINQSDTRIGTFPSGFVVYNVVNGVIGEGRLVRLDP